MSKHLIWVVGLWFIAWAAPAEAQLRKGDFRLSLDTDMISIAGVTVDPEGPGRSEAMVFGIGPNQLGASQVLMPASPFGLGFGWVLTRKLVLGLRSSFGFDIVSPDGSTENRKLLALNLTPGLTIVPIGHRAKLFIALSPLLQVNRDKFDENIDRYLLGGFSTGIGALIFPGSSVSVDLGFFFEGKFGNRRVEVDDNVDVTAHVQVLQGVVRLGISLWK